MPSTSTDVIDGVSTSSAFKAIVRGVCTTNITLSGLSAISTVEGTMTPADGDRFLLTGQNAGADNLIWEARTGAWTLAPDADGSRDLVKGSVVKTQGGVEYHLTTANPISPGTTSLTWARIDTLSDTGRPAAVATIAALKALTGMINNQQARVAGYYTAGDGGGGDFYWDASSSATDNGGTVIKPTAVSGAGRWLATGDMSDLRRWGAVVGQTATVIKDAIQTALDAGGSLRLVDTGTAYSINSKLLLDVSKSSLNGDGPARIDATAITNDAAIQVFSSASYGQNESTKNFQNKVRGISFIGGDGANTIGAQIGRVGASYTQSSDILFEDCSFWKFYKQIDLIENAWRTHFNRCAFENPVNRFISFDAPSNAGEVITFTDCRAILQDYAAYAYLKDGQFYFRNFSFPAGGNAGSFQLLNSAHVLFSGCNFETQPQTTDHVLLECYNNSHAILDACTLIHNESDTNYSVAPFLVNDGATLELHGCSLPLFDNYDTEGAEGVRQIVGGDSSRVLLRDNIVSGGGSTTITEWAVVSKRANSIYNGDAEVNTTGGWVTGTTGAGGTFTNVTTSPKNGSRHYLLDAFAGGTIDASQTIDVSGKIGGVIVQGFWAQTTAGSGTTCLPTLQFLGPNDVAISTYGAIAVTASNSSSYTWFGQSTIIPAGTIKCKVNFSTGAAAAQTVRLDDVIVNVL